ncbi:MAG: SGNH/GDSL hydrolase family protein [Lachnospiraceae bacterium]|nr:SGNH/GDSL hydrolase family protein [Lachnospiraceae bacterium]
MEKKHIGDILFSLLLAVIAVAGITRFLIMPYMQQKGLLNKDGDKTSTEVTTEVSEEEPEVSVEPAKPEKEEPSVSIEKPDESQKKDEEKKEDKKDAPTEPFADVVDGIEVIKHPHNREAVENPDIDHCDVVFLGDSVFVFGDDRGVSIPQKVEDITEGTWAYSISQPGLAAGASTNDKISLGEEVQYFIDEDFPEDRAFEDETLRRELQEYWLDDHTDRQLVIVLNAAINDYYQGTPLTGEPYDDNTYVGAWRNVLGKLTDEFPNAKIIVCRTYTIRHEEYGYNFNGAGSTYNMYKDALAQVVREYPTVYKVDLDGSDGINYDNTDQYLEDGTHTNEAGAELVANILIDYIKAILG